MTPAPSQLDYASRPPTIWRKWMLWVGLALAGLVIAVPAWKVGEVSLARWEVIRWQRASLRYTLPAGTVAFEEKSDWSAAAWARIARSARAGAYYRLDGNNEVPKEISTRVATGDDRSVAPSIAAAGPTSLWLLPEPWHEFAARLPGGVSIEPVLFLHERAAHGSGEGRLVCVTYPAVGLRGVGRLDRFVDGRVFNWHSCSRATPFTPTVAVTGWATVAPPAFDLVPFGGLRFYAGQPDPADESHFTIDYETPDGRGTIDGWLMADDTVKLEVRDGPAARR